MSETSISHLIIVYYVVKGLERLFCLFLANGNVFHPTHFNPRRFFPAVRGDEHEPERKPRESERGEAIMMLMGLRFVNAVYLWFIAL